MATNADFYRDRADDARREAEGADLANVRERCLRAAIAWEAMATRAARSNRLRAEEAARKASMTTDSETADCSAST